MSASGGRVTPESPEPIGGSPDQLVPSGHKPRLFPQMERARDIRVTYVQQAGGPPSIPPGTPGYMARILESQVYPMLHVDFLMDGVRKTTLIDLSQIRKRGLPDDYESLKRMFPLIRWSAS